MPKPLVHALIWSHEHQHYTLHSHGQPRQDFLPEDQLAFARWLDGHTAFAFEGQAGRITVLKEARSRGSGYWYAYRTHQSRTRKRYLGRTQTLSLARLEEIAQSFNHDEQEQTERSLHMAPAPISWQTTQAGFAIPSNRGMSADEFNDSNMLVRTRLSPPHLPTTLVVRERLLSTLDAALSRPLILLSASAGGGKTTLLSAWAQRQQGPVAWLSLEALDNDPTRFWISLIVALRRWWPQIGEHALPQMHGGHLSASITMLLNELVDRSSRPSPIVLILDDYHVIDEPTIHASLTFFLEHLPPHVHLLLASRFDPELPLARLRARGQMIEMRDSDLRFTPEETQHFLTQCMELALSQAAIAVLQTRTEGWIAGLHLAALVLQKQAVPSAYVSTLSGSDRFLLDYMREEILAGLPQPLHDFLLQTSGLSRLSASLCDAVTGRHDSEFVLEQVMRANLFLQALPGEHPWYRYHAWWAQALQYEARRRLGTATMHELSRQASVWYEQHQMLPEAIEAGLAGEDFGRVASLIERFVTPQSFHNAYHTLSRWLRQLPEEIMRTRPELFFQSVLALMFTTDRRSPATREQAERLLQRAELGFEATAQWEYLGETLQLHSDLAFFQEDMPRAFAFVQQAQPRLSQDSFMYPDLLLLKGVAARLSGEVNRAWQYFLEGYQREKHLGDHAAAFGASLCLGEVCLEKGELRRASHYYQQALAHLHEDQEVTQEQLRFSTGSAEPFFVSWAYHCLAQLAYERNAFADAQHALSEAQALRETPAEGVHVLTSGMLVQARLLHACGQTEKALELLARWERQARFPWPLRVIRNCRAQLQLATGDLSAVEQWVQEKEQAELSQDGEQMQAFPLLFQQEEALLLARFHIAQQQAEIALQELVSWKEQAQAQGRQRSVLEILILEALAHGARQEDRQARSCLREAVSLAHAENYQRLFLDAGPMMERLLTMIVPELSIPSQALYVRNLLRAFAGETDPLPANEITSAFEQVGTSRSRQRTSISETALSSARQAAVISSSPEIVLTRREQEVLRLLAAGSSNQDIAQALVISLDTVKKHVSHLFGKLGASSRTQAAALARAHSLL